MSHSQFHSTKLFILRPLTHRDIVNTLAAFPQRKVSPSLWLSSPGLAGDSSEATRLSPRDSTIS